MIANIIRNAKKTVTGGDPYYSAVSLLLPMDGTNGSTTFTDSSQNALAVTAVGNAQISTAQSKFGGSAAYFDGSGDYLTTPDNNAFRFGSGDFTVELWAYFSSSVSGLNYGIIGQGTVAFTSNAGWIFLRHETNKLRFIFTDNGTSSYRICDSTAAFTPSTNTWYHIAVTRNAGTVTLFINGVNSGSASLNYSVYASTLNLSVGADSAGGIPFQGYIDDLRITKYARYTSNFTPPTTALPTTASSTPADPYYGYTSLLLHMDGSSGSTNFVDSGPNALAVTAVGNTQISTTQSKYGGASAYFDGTGDYLSFTGGMPSGSGTAFTIEFWMMLDAFSTYRSITRTAGGLDINVRPNGAIGCDQTSVAVIAASAAGVIIANTWYHVAVTRDTSNNYKLFVNGTQMGSGTNSFSVTAATTIGYSAAGPTVYFKGYIDDFRATNALRYTSSFTPPAQAHPNIYNPYTTLPVSGAALWLDASQQNTIFTDAGTTPVTTSGQSIYQWNDLSGNNRHAVQATSGNRPTWVPPASGQNGLGAISFNGSNQLISTATSGLSAQPFEYYIVFKFKSTTTNDRIVFGTGDRGNFDGNSGGGWNLFSGALLAGGTRTGTSWAMVNCKFNGSSSALRVNASQVLSGNTGTGYPTAFSLAGNGSSDWGDITVAEFVVYSSTLSTGDQNLVESYLQTKWGTP